MRFLELAIVVELFLEECINGGVEGKGIPGWLFDAEPVIDVEAARAVYEQFDLGAREFEVVLYARDVIPVFMAGNFVVL